MEQTLVAHKKIDELSCAGIYLGTAGAVKVA